MPFLVPPDSIDTDELVLVLAFGAPSLLEAQCVLGDHAKLALQCEDIATVKLDGKQPKKYELAGVHKIAVPLPPIDSPDFMESITFPDRNFNFSLSLYCSGGDSEAEYRSLSEDLLSAMRSAGQRKANLIRPRSGSELRSEQVVGRSAMDFVAFPLGALFQWGITVYTPETEEFRIRSTERPFVSPSISLSSRLARLLVNVAGVSKGQVLLDPFCGSGTILGEALLQGVDCIGIDRNHGSVERTKKNLSWILAEGGYRGSGAPSFSVRKGDATNLRKTLGDQMVDAIVSEPILMPRLSSAPNIEKARRLVKHASFTYSEALYEMSSVLRPGGRMVLVTPSVRTVEGKEVSVKFDELDEAGLRFFQPPGGRSFEYPLKFSHQSTRWIRRLLYVLEKT